MRSTVRADWLVGGSAVTSLYSCSEVMAYPALNQIQSGPAMRDVCAATTEMTSRCDMPRRTSSPGVPRMVGDPQIAA